jgi:GAF domain-containing protein/HAMP domain-containing protein
MILPLMDTAIQAGTTQAGQIVRTTSFDGSPVIADFAWLPAMQTGLVVEMPTEVAFGELDALGPYILAVTLVLGGLVFGFIWFATRRLISPLQDLTQAAESFARGQWEQRAPASSYNNEIGQLSLAFNRMADELSSSYQSLESQVHERTNSLEKRSQQLQATAIVARQAASIRNLDDLLNNLTHQISEQFGYYHVGIFLLDENQRFAILQASNSPGGQAMLTRAHRLEVGQVGVVGHVASTGLPRVALDVGADAFFFNNPDLPDTRSELALPLKIRGQVVGVLDVQSTQPAAFEGPDVEVLQIMADQISLSIENARLLEQSQEAIHQLQRTYGSQLGDSWDRWLRNRPIAYSFDRVRLTQPSSGEIERFQALSSEQPTIRKEGDEMVLAVPIQLRDQKLGSILLHRDVSETPWTPVELDLVSEATQQIALALENARLLDETMRRAEHEQTVSEFATQIARTVDIDSILRTAVRQLGQLPHVADVSVHLGNLEGH